MKERQENELINNPGYGMLSQVGDAQRQPDSLDEMEQWSLVARSALLVSRGTLELERERLVVEANELAALVLGESSAGSSVRLVRRRLEEGG